MNITGYCPFGNEEDGLEVRIEFSYTPGAGPTGPSYSSGGEPGYGAEIEFVGAKCVHHELPASLQPWLDEWAADYLAGDYGRDKAIDEATS